MNTRAIAGIGNIYACETLFRAGSALNLLRRREGPGAETGPPTG
jgi:hypothetical protein